MSTQQQEAPKPRTNKERRAATLAARAALAARPEPEPVLPVDVALGKRAATLPPAPFNLDGPVLCKHCKLVFISREAAWRHRGADPSTARCAKPANVGLYMGYRGVWCIDYAESRKLDQAAAEREAANALHFVRSKTDLLADPNRQPAIGEAVYVGIGPDGFRIWDRVPDPGKEALKVRQEAESKSAEAMPCDVAQTRLPEAHESQSVQVPQSDLPTRAVATLHGLGAVEQGK